ADTKPELEIFADDVVCSHGATVGEIDENQLFYLVSRGIPTAQARAMLIEAFLIDTLTHIRAPELSEQVQFHIQDWVLKSALLSANNV
ncbi:SufD family Fe-S cluster assembly protein, partial [Alphaproteobacteria bacterium]|nr:SufD family Fe-S cluster assembly protein [Alphaproteobacteria bacterium]